jgi:hypothetical protein
MSIFFIGPFGSLQGEWVGDNSDKVISSLNNIGSLTRRTLYDIKILNNKKEPRIETRVGNLSIWEAIISSLDMLHWLTLVLE